MTTNISTTIEAEIVAGVQEATYVEGPFEFGHYIERLDGDHWTPLIYGDMTEDEAWSHHDRHRGDDEESGPFRRSRVVRRSVSPWEVRER